MFKREMMGYIILLLHIRINNSEVICGFTIMTTKYHPRSMKNVVSRRMPQRRKPYVDIRAGKAAYDVNVGETIV